MGVIDFISPEWALKRAIAKHKLKMARSFDASKVTRRSDRWVPKSGSPIEQTDTDRATLVGRSSDLCDNNGYGRRARTAVKNHAVGIGIVPNFKINGRRNSDLDELFKLWAESAKACDYDEHSTFYALQSVVMSEIFTTGDVLIRRYFVRPTVENPIPLRIQVLTGEFLDYDKGLQGVDYSEGKVKGYWVRKIDPTFGDYTTQSTYVSRDECELILRKDRAGQIRGIPWLAPVVLDLRELDEYQDAELVRRKIASAFAAFVTDVDPDEMADEDNPNAEEHKFGTLKPGMITELPPGRDIRFASPPSVTDSPFVTDRLRKIAVGVGVTYETLTADYSKVNFSSARMGYIDMYRNIDEWRTHMLIPQMCHRVIEWFKTAVALSNLNAVVEGQVQYTPPRREFIDPGKEIAALKDAVRNGFMTYQQVVRVLGYDPFENLDDIQQFNEEVDQREIILDIDPRFTSKQGQYQDTNEVTNADSE